MQKEIEKSARELARTIYKGEHGNKSKPNFWACGPDAILSSTKGICAECEDIIYYDGSLEKDFCKGAKKLCLKCVLKNYGDKITALERELIEKRLELG